MEYCVCGHKIIEHVQLAEDSNTVCSRCFMNGAEFHPFKLDNLKLIEDLAKEKKLL